MSGTKLRVQSAIVSRVEVDDERLRMFLTDGRELSAPTSIRSRLSRATLAQRDNWQIIGKGIGVHWPDVDEDIGVWSLLGVPEDVVLHAAGFNEPAKR